MPGEQKLRVLQFKKDPLVFCLDFHAGDKNPKKVKCYLVVVLKNMDLEHETINIFLFKLTFAHCLLIDSVCISLKLEQCKLQIIDVHPQW